jgi:hypothetical protein
VIVTHVMSHAASTTGVNIMILGDRGFGNNVAYSTVVIRLPPRSLVTARCVREQVGVGGPSR